MEEGEGESVGDEGGDLHRLVPFCRFSFIKARDTLGAIWMIGTVV